MDLPSTTCKAISDIDTDASASASASAKHPLVQPMLVIAGLAAGIMSGLILSLTFTPVLSTQEKLNLPANYSTAALLQPTPRSGRQISAVEPSLISAAQSSRISAAQLSRKHANRVSAKPSIKRIDPASRYLTASKTLTHESIDFLGLLTNTSFTRPNWSWSREDFSIEHATTSRVFGAQTSTVKVAQAPKANAERLVVVLDPGHGGIDPGSEAHNGLIEKELTLDMAKRVELFLSEIENVDVVMTRNSDKGMSRQNRVNKIKAVGADVVVSLHFNHLPQTDINLVETFYADRHNVIESLQKQNLSPSSVNLDHTSASKTLANIMHKKVYNEVATANSAVIDAGVKRETLFVLTRSFTPGVLLELTCISNPAEAERLALPSYRNQLAAAIADGLREYLVDFRNEQRSEQRDDVLVKLDL